MGGGKQESQKFKTILCHTGSSRLAISGGGQLGGEGYLFFLFVFVFVFFFHKTGFHCVALAILENETRLASKSEICLPLAPKCWD